MWAIRSKRVLHQIINAFKREIYLEKKNNTRMEEGIYKKKKQKKNPLTAYCMKLVG